MVPAFADHWYASQRMPAAKRHHDLFLQAETLQEKVLSPASESSILHPWLRLLAALPDVLIEARNKRNELTFKKACSKVDAYLTVPQALAVKSNLFRDRLCVKLLETF